MNTLVAVVAGLIGAGVCLRADMHRRQLFLTRRRGWKPPTVLDVACVAASVGVASALLILAAHEARADALFTPATLAITACALSLVFLWSEGRSQVQLQRPNGIVFAEWLILFGAYQLLARFLSLQLLWPGAPRWEAFGAAVILPIAAGSVLLALIVPRFVKGKESHRILERIAAQGEFVQSEYVKPTPECPFPERWKMLDAESAELEVLDLLKALVIAAKPELVVETGTFIGHSAIKMAEGMRANGFGKIITIEYDPAVFGKAKQNIEASGFADLIACRNCSSLETRIDGAIDILFSDSEVTIREQEVRHFLPQVRPRGLVLIHDASSNFKVVREAAFRLEQEGLLSVVLLSTPRGLMIGQKREGRT